MRPSVDRALLAGMQLNHFLKVEVQGPDGAWINLSSMGGHDWVDSATWGAGIDRPVASGSVVIRREIDGVSIAPFMTGSITGNGLFSPRIGPGRGIRIAIAVAPKGATSVVWHTVYIGKIDEIESGGNGGTMRIRHRDIGARLLDTVFEVDRTYGSETGTPLQQVLQRMLDHTVGVGAVDLYVQDDPDFIVYPFVQDRDRSLLAGMRDLALQAGFDLRYMWTADGGYRLTLYMPDREKTEPDTEFSASEWQEVSELTLTDADVKNVIEVVWTDPTSGETRSAIARDDDSIREFRGRRYMRLEGDATRHITNGFQADALARAVLSDLAFPTASQSIRTLLFWPAQLGDLYQLNPDGVHYTQPILAAVTAFEHSFSNGTGWTTLKLRGRPSGARHEWLRRGPSVLASVPL